MPTLDCLLTLRLALKSTDLPEQLLQRSGLNQSYHAFVETRDAAGAMLVLSGLMHFWSRYRLVHRLKICLTHFDGSKSTTSVKRPAEIGSWIDKALVGHLKFAAQPGPSSGSVGVEFTTESLPGCETAPELQPRCAVIYHYGDSSYGRAPLSKAQSSASISMTASESPQVGEANSRSGLHALASPQAIDEEIEVLEARIRDLRSVKQLLIEKSALSSHLQAIELKAAHDEQTILEQQSALEQKLRDVRSRSGQLKKDLSTKLAILDTQISDHGANDYLGVIVQHQHQASSDSPGLEFSKSGGSRMMVGMLSEAGSLIRLPKSSHPIVSTSSRDTSNRTPTSSDVSSPGGEAGCSELASTIQDHSQQTSSLNSCQDPATASTSAVKRSAEEAPDTSSKKSSSSTEPIFPSELVKQAQDLIQSFRKEAVALDNAVPNERPIENGPGTPSDSSILASDTFPSKVDLVKLPRRRTSNEQLGDRSSRGSISTTRPGRDFEPF